VASLGALSQAWVSAEASRPRDWQVTGLWRFGDVWSAIAEGPRFDDYLSASGQQDYQALQRLADRLRARRGSMTDPDD
jgi:hypothetical protein